MEYDSLEFKEHAQQLLLLMQLFVVLTSGKCIWAAPDATLWRKQDRHLGGQLHVPHQRIGRALVAQQAPPHSSPPHCHRRGLSIQSVGRSINQSGLRIENARETERAPVHRLIGLMISASESSSLSVIQLLPSFSQLCFDGTFLLSLPSPFLL
jgi:hypothetical protein